MAKSRSLAAKLARIAELQALRTMASEMALAGAQRECDEARDRADGCEQALAERAAEVERCFGNEALDLTAIGIGRAMLAALGDERDRALGEFRAAHLREGERRADWLRETRLSERTGELLRKATRHASQKREDATVTELSLLRFARADEVRA